jgi:hypothetical protein
MNLIATIPRSGTWYITAVLNCYSALVRGELPILKDMIKQGVSNQVGDIIICHMEHPLSENVEKYPLHGYNWGNQAYKDVKFDSVTFVVREFNSQVESYWKHTRDHKQDFPSDRDEFYSAAVACYHKMLDSYINNPCIGRITYEDLIEQPLITIYAMLIDMGKKVDTESLEMAIRLCTKENIKKAELESGKTLANDVNRNSHITGG